MLTAQDRIDITDLINLHGHLTDAGDLDGAGDLFTPDVTYDVRDFGLGSLHGTAAIREAALELGQRNPVGHHVTNVVITEVDGEVRVRSKGIGIMANGKAGSVVYDDVVTRRPDGWKISYRKVSVRRTALGEREPGPRDVLDRFRAAAISQSPDELRRLYAPDAVHEFPFTRPGLPTKLEGRDAIMSWVVAMWQGNPMKYERYRTLAIHDTGDPDTIVVEQEAVGTGRTGDFVLPNIVVLTVRNGQIAVLRDYVNILAAMAAIGDDQDR